MDQKTYQSMYKHIEMKQEHKTEILQSLTDNKVEKEKTRRYHFSGIAAAGLCILLLSGTSVLAAQYFYLGDRMADSLHTFSQNTKSATKEEKQLYETYGMELNQSYQRNGYKIQLEAAICDSTYLFIPFTVTDIQNEAYRNDTNVLSFRTKDEESDIGVYSMIDSKSKDGTTAKGSYLVCDIPLEEGKVIEVIEQESEKVLGEFTLEKTMMAETKSIDVSKIERKNDARIQKMTVSPLSVHIEGTYSNWQLSDRGIHVFLKDGTEVEQSTTGSGSSYFDEEEETKRFSCQILFKEPVDLSQVKEIVIGNGGEDTKIRVPY